MSGADGKSVRKGNRGEWSELYAFLQLLAEGQAAYCNGKLETIEGKCSLIQKVYRTASEPRVCYQVNRLKHCVEVIGESSTIEVSQSAFAEHAGYLLGAIKQLKQKESNTVPALEAFLDSISCDGVKAKSSDKADLRLVLHDIALGSTPELGYSVKSRLGGQSTLFNVNRDATNFLYRLTGVDSATAASAALLTPTDGSSKKDFRSLFRLLAERCVGHSFVGVCGRTFRGNLRLLDRDLEAILAECLWLYYTRDTSGVRTLAQAARHLAESDPLALNEPGGQPMYEYKLKQFLLAAALGMTSGTPWHGRFDANGGYIVVKESGEVACLHFYDRNNLEDYLFLNTAFETPSSSRHGFGTLSATAEPGVYTLTLALQVRFV